MTLLTSRIVMLVPLGIVWLIRRKFGNCDRRTFPLLVLMSGSDLTGAGLVRRGGAVAALSRVVSVLASLYPVITALLARFIQHERLKSVQVVGVLTALGGVALITIG